jgi:lipopolysaccharide biosynthesis protein
VLPLLQEGLPFVARYDLALHLHSKRSDAAWLNHQLNALVGDQRWCAGITELFRALPQLGLLMPRPPESLRPYLSWAGNAQHAEQLIRQLWPECEFPVQAPLVFPAGMMFWFRPQALTSLQQATQALLGLKPEPLPLDGTQLHALERLTAHACERAGFGWALVDEQAAHTNADAAANAEQIWRRPIRVWREESVAYQQGLKALSDQFRKCQGELRRLTGVEQDLRHALTTLHRDHEQQLATIHKNWEQHLAAVQTEWAQHLDTIGGYQESRGCLLHRLSRRLRRLWSANHKGRSK